MDENFEGTQKMTPEDPNLLERYREFYKTHEDWLVESYSLGGAYRRNFMLNSIFKFMAFRRNEKLQGILDNSPDLPADMKELMIKKQIFTLQ